MQQRSSIDHYRSRHQQELTMAMKAASPAVEAIHLEMAKLYADLVNQAQTIVFLSMSDIDAHTHINVARSGR